MADESEDPTWQPEHLNISARLQSLRNLLNSERRSGIDHQRARDALEQEMSERSAEESLASLERRRRELETNLHEHDPPATANVHTASPNNFLMERARRRMFRPSQRLHRRRQSYTESNRPESRLEDPDTLTSPRRPTPPFAFVEPAVDEYHSAFPDSRDQRFRSKRRKLDDGTFEDETKIMKYGDKGRVTPGPLKVEIVSCDGGDYCEDAKGLAQNVLQDDRSVYSTKSNKCNMLMKHVGGMPFSLTKIVFKAPRDGYDAPVQEGMIFVAMDDEDILKKTSQYEVRYSPKSYRYHHQRRHDQHRLAQEWLNPARSPLRSVDRTRHGRDHQDPYTHHSWTRAEENDLELETAVVPGFQVAFADPSDSDDTSPRSPRSPRHWDYGNSPRTSRAYTDRYRPNYGEEMSYVDLSPTSDESEHDEAALGPRPTSENLDLLHAVSRQRRLQTLRNAPERADTDWQILHRRYVEDWQDLTNLVNPRRSTPSRVEVRNNEAVHDHSRTPTTNPTPRLKAQAENGWNQATQSASEVVPPHARFFINRRKSSIAVHFDPPVSGRYILLKLWAACPNANIDIQSIIAHGYGGPRFFSASEMR